MVSDMMIKLGCSLVKLTVVDRIMLLPVEATINYRIAPEGQICSVFFIQLQMSTLLIKRLASIDANEGK